MRILQIGADRSKRGILFPGSAAYKRQEAYAKEFGDLDIIGFSRRSDGAQESASGSLRVIPTNSASSLLYGLNAIRIAKRLPGPDVVSVQDPFETGLVAWLIARIFGVPLHVQVHTDFLSPQYQSRFGWLRRAIAAFVLRRAARVRVVSERIKTSIARAYHLHAPVSVLPIFADVERFKHSVSDSELMRRFSRFQTKLLVVARLEPEKNVTLALRVFKEILKVSPLECCLIIVGEGSEQEKLMHLAQELGVADRIFFEGECDPAPYYALADLVLVTSKYEGYGLVIVEALAAGKPVLATDVGIAREAGAIVASEDRFADALTQWIASGPRTGVLHDYPYHDFDEYVRAYCDDVGACATGR